MPSKSAQFFPVVSRGGGAFTQPHPFVIDYASVTWILPVWRQPKGKVGIGKRCFHRLGLFHECLMPPAFVIQPVFVHLFPPSWAHVAPGLGNFGGQGFGGTILLQHLTLKSSTSARFQCQMCQKGFRRRDAKPKKTPGQAICNVLECFGPQASSRATSIPLLLRDE